MSKIRIVGGKYIKITEGAHEIYGKRIDYTAQLKVRNDGVKGGVHNTNNPKSPPPPPDKLQVIKIEGPYDDSGNLIEYVDKGEFYSYKSTVNRMPLPHEILLLKWDREYDDNQTYKRVHIGGTLLEDGKISFKFRVGTETVAKKLTIYAYFEKRGINAKVETDVLIKEVIIIVGTEQYYTTNPANKLMFPGQAVRIVRTKFTKHPNLEVLIFKDGYTENQLSAISKALIKINKETRVTYIENIDSVINFINFGQKDGVNKRYPYRKVSEIYIYSHGYVRSTTNEGAIAFGYNGKNADKQELDIKSFNKIDAKVFLESNQTKLYSYACRTGIGTASETSTNPLKNNSLAQKMASKGKIVVHAYMRRSLYEDTWGTPIHRHTYASDNDEGNSTWENFKSDIKDVVSTDPSDMKKYSEYRKKEVRIDGAIWNPEGAYLGVKAGDLPITVPSTFDEYKPK
jgi:hypothetical protein